MAGAEVVSEVVAKRDWEEVGGGGMLLPRLSCLPLPPPPHPSTQSCHTPTLSWAAKGFDRVEDQRRFFDQVFKSKED